MTGETSRDEAEVGTFSIWFLRGVLVLTCLVVLGFLLHAAVGLFGGDGTASDDESTNAEQVMTSDDESTDETSTSSTSLSPSSEAPATTPIPDGNQELQVFVDEAIGFIEATRQRAFVERPVVEVVSVDAMTEVVLDDIRKTLAADPEAAEASLALSRAIGFFGPADEFLGVYEVFVSAGVLGVYFPDSDRLLVRSASELTLSTKATIVHELVHAFDDQHFDLDRNELSDDGDAGWTFGAAVEGSASWVEEAWRVTLTTDEASELLEEELSFDTGDIFSLDFGFLVYQTSVYEAGRVWLDRRVVDEGIAAIDDALINGAASSEVVMMALDAPNLDPIDVVSPAVDGEVLWQGRGGQALIAALTFLAEQSETAAIGWGGDAMTVYYDSEGLACLRWDLVGDTAIDTSEIFEELGRWVTAIGGTAEMVDGLVRIDRCA